MLIGYARGSTQHQTLAAQREALRAADCERLYDDHLPATPAPPAALQSQLVRLHEGDTFVVCKLDRLGKSVKQMVDLIRELERRGIQFKSLTDSIDTGAPAGHFFFEVMARLAEMEHELTVERTRAGLEVARQFGRKGGRKPKMTDSKMQSARKLLASGVPPKEVARNLGVSVPTLYRWLPASTQA